MRAAILRQFGSPLTIEEVPDPEVGTGEVVVDITATMVLHYTDEVLSGERRYQLALPVVPGLGGIGRVRATGPDATHLRVGDWVLCDPTIRSRDGGPTPDITLQGWSGRGEGGMRLQGWVGDGTFAERVRVPTENAFPLGDITVAEAGRWCALSLLLVPYGGLQAIDLRAGETIVVSGATGTYGGAAVAVALAMGAGCVVAPGRNQARLDDLRRRFGDRVRPVSLSGEEGEDTDRMRAAAPGPIDCVIDLLPPSAPTAPVRAAAMAVREFGRVALMGGVGMLGGDDLALPYPWLMRNSVTIRGQWMCPRSAVAQMIPLAQSGLLDLGQYQVADFTLDQANEAVAHAAADEAPFDITVLRP